MGFISFGYDSEKDGDSVTRKKSHDDEQFVAGVGQYLHGHRLSPGDVIETDPTDPVVVDRVSISYLIPHDQAADSAIVPKLETTDDAADDSAVQSDG